MILEHEGHFVFIGANVREETEPARIEHLFVVRMWQEASQTLTRQWRGLVEHVPTGRRLYFTSFGDLNDFMTRRLNRASRREESDEQGIESKDE